MLRTDSGDENRLTSVPIAPLGAPEPSISVASVSHELRNAVTAVRLLAEAARDGILDDRGAGGAMDQMVEHLQLMTALMAQLDAASPPRIGAVAPPPLMVDEMLERWADAMRVVARTRDVEIEVSCDEDLPAVACSVGHFSRVVSNLLTESVTATRGGGVITMRAVPHPGGVQVQIDDPRPASAARARRRLLAGSGARSRTDRGMAVARAIVEAHGGRLWIASEGGAGAGVRFSLPSSQGATASA